MSPDRTPLDEGARSAILDRSVQRYVADGYSVIVRTTTTAQLVKPKQWNWMSAIIWFVVGLLTVGFGLVAYLLYYLLIQKDKRVYLSVNEVGTVQATNQS